MTTGKLSNNDLFLINAARRNHDMPPVAFTKANQVLDIELDSVPGWAYELVLSVNVDLAIDVAAGGASPSWSKFFPWNIFERMELSLGGGPFQRVKPFFHYLRQRAMRPGWTPGGSPTSYAYTQSTAWNVPGAPNAPVGATTDNNITFTIRVPLQSQHGDIMGHLPLGDARTTAKLRLVVASNLYGSDQYECPVTGGANVTVSIGNVTQSQVGVSIRYRTTPATKAQVPDPVVGQILNVQEQVVPFSAAGQNTPIYFKDPFFYLRLWHIIIDGTGAPNSIGVTNFELDLVTGYPQFRYDTPSALQGYFSDVNELYKGDLDTGVFVMDLWSGSDPANPNGEQMIDGTLFQTLQTRIGTANNFNVASPAKIITYAEALSAVDF